MSSLVDLAHFNEHGWVRAAEAVPKELCAELVSVIESEFGLSVNDPDRWPTHSGGLHDLLPIWGHQVQWDIRQCPRLHRIWAKLWGNEALWVTLDSCRFTPPWRPGDEAPYDLHWDRDPWDDGPRMLQGVLALTDTAADQGGFRCVPSLYRDRSGWPKEPAIDTDGDANWLADAQGRDVLSVPAQAGDLIVWDSRLPHGNSRNLSAKPRLAFYVAMYPAGDQQMRDAAIQSWRTGRCVPWWRTRQGYDRVEPWPPASLMPLGRKLIGLDAWEAS